MQADVSHSIQRVDEETPLVEEGKEKKEAPKLSIIKFCAILYFTVWSVTLSLLLVISLYFHHKFFSGGPYGSESVLNAYPALAFILILA